MLAAGFSPDTSNTTLNKLMNKLHGCISFLPYVAPNSAFVFVSILFFFNDKKNLDRAVKSLRGASIGEDTIVVHRAKRGDVEAISRGLNLEGKNRRVKIKLKRRKHDSSSSSSDTSTSSSDSGGSDDSSDSEHERRRARRKHRREQQAPANTATTTGGDLEMVDHPGNEDLSSNGRNTVMNAYNRHQENRLNTLQHELGNQKEIIEGISTRLDEHIAALPATLDKNKNDVFAALQTMFD